MIDEDLAHETGTEGEEVFAVGELGDGGLVEPKEEFVGEGGGLEGVVRALALHEAAGDAA
jgi:hypothetical protein